MQDKKEEAKAREKPKSGRFVHFAAHVSSMAGRPVAFMLACAVIAVWALAGPIFGYSDTWQLIINTGTTVVTFLMVFLIQNTQNRESLAMQVKLDELIRAMEGAENSLLDLEDMTDEELAEIRQKYLDLAEEARRHLEDEEPDAKA